MSHKSILGLWLSLVLFGAGTFGAEELNGILGESVTFQVKTSPPFETISLNKIINSNPRSVALVTFKELSCTFLFLHPDFQKRLNISSDCRNLHLGPLKKEDTGRYSVLIVLPTKTTVVESFDLRVFRTFGAEELNGILGESVTFQVKTSPPFETISLNKIINSNPRSVALVTFKELSCTFLFLHPDFQKRLNISSDCRNLHLGPLKKEDTGRYSVLIVLPTKTTVVESFDLRVFRTFGAEELNGILGESVTFQVKTSPPFETISLNKIINSNPRSVALVTFKELSCTFLFLHPDFQKRLNISSDCRNLHLGPLKKEDTGRYSVLIVLPTKTTVVESFDLRVFKRLVDSELNVTCTPEGTGNRTWQLTCSTGTWEDRVNISWTSSAQSTGPTPWSSVLRFVSQDLDATCRAENPVSQASRTVSLKEVCAEERPGTEDPQVNVQTTNLSKLPLWALLCLIEVGNLLLLGCLVLILMMKSRKADGGGGRRAQPHPGDD
ncbi:uncharacterized protein LOC116523549 [Thamnophis elegans]|uniref:uncharacterized protein LOC116523549 n=1 Tax=Thamnophis elegans TaxID=35005 RepID=UPI00137800E5|nr:uncharacterized protein LOC116523549 [Thamnophis elegans]